MSKKMIEQRKGLVTRGMNPMTALCLVGFLAGFISGCATLPKDFAATPSHALPPGTPTTLQKFIAPSADAHPGQSGFLVLDAAPDAFFARLALADMAEKTLDAQYFIWNRDSAGIILMDRLYQAAERGVRVRLLLDDTTSGGKDWVLGALNAHPEIEIRLFNPLGRRFKSGVSRTISMGLHVGRMTNRMHNKTYIVDNQFVIVGGRNIADEYFGLNQKANFRDMDLLGGGPVAADVSNMFDAYWNSPWSIPLEAAGVKTPSPASVEKKRRKFKTALEKMKKDFPIPLDFNKDEVVARLNDLRSHFVWAPSEVVGDDPGKSFEVRAPDAAASAIVNRLTQVGAKAKKEILVVSPYFILDQTDYSPVGNRVRGGLTIKILTNSMASTDALPVVAMYKGQRPGLLAEGMHLYEYRDDAASQRHVADPKNKARRSLHAKLTVFDRESVFVGTYNIDPRSHYLNTEVGLLVHSPELARQVADAVEKDLAPENSWRLSLDEKKKVLWVGESDGEEVRFSKDPHTGFWKRFLAGFFALLPIKGQL